MWNWSKCAISNDSIFVTSCINHAFKDEIKWPTPKEGLSLSVHLQEITRCIRFIDGTLMGIHKP
jgi:hypothetical protein